MQREDIANLLQNIELRLGWTSSEAAKQAGVTTELWNSWKEGHKITQVIHFLSCLEAIGWELKIVQTGPGDEPILSASQVSSKPRKG